MNVFLSGFLKSTSHGSSTELSRDYYAIRDIETDLIPERLE
jgi:hypothetical protein